MSLLEASHCGWDVALGGKMDRPFGSSIWAQWGHRYGLLPAPAGVAQAGLQYGACRRRAGGQAGMWVNLEALCFAALPGGAVCSAAWPSWAGALRCAALVRQLGVSGVLAEGLACGPVLSCGRHTPA
jgi:hypothetical protein